MVEARASGQRLTVPLGRRIVGPDRGPPMESRERETPPVGPGRERSIRLAVILGILSLPSIPLIQYVARRLPLVALGKVSAVYLSVTVAFVLSVTALCLAEVYLRRIERDIGKPLLPASVVYFALALLLGGLVFASISDFVKPRSPLLRCVPPLIVVAALVAGYFLISARGRKAFASDDASRIGLEFLRYAEVLALAGLAVALLRPDDPRCALALLHFGVTISPFAVSLAFSLNHRAEQYRSVRCRLKSYAVSAPIMVFIILMMGNVD
jgi:hypothetical protein